MGGITSKGRLALEDGRRLESFKKYVEKSVVEGADLGALFDNIDKKLSWDENDRLLRESFPFSFKQENLLRFTPREDYMGGLISDIAEKDPREYRRLVRIGDRKLKEVKRPRVEWVTYGRRSYYTKGEASKINEELKSQSFETMLSHHPAYEEYTILYKSVEGKKPKDISIE